MEIARGFPGLAGDLTAFVGRLLSPLWALLRIGMHLIIKVRGRGGG